MSTRYTTGYFLHIWTVLWSGTNRSKLIKKHFIAHFTSQKVSKLKRNTMLNFATCQLFAICLLLWTGRMFKCWVILVISDPNLTPNLTLNRLKIKCTVNPYYKDMNNSHVKIYNIIWTIKIHISGEPLFQIAQKFTKSEQMN